tara:strand:+ start:1685 stop:2791 length:1107 start_codon:yes stop_codon:yes gene_type:complete
MKFSIVKSDLLKPLSHIYSVVEKRNTIPILSNVVIEASENDIAFTATDMEIDIVEGIKANVISTGKLTVSAHTLYDIVRKLPDGSEVVMHIKENKLILSCGKSEFTLPTLPFDDYPIMTEITGGKNFSISSADLQNLIDNTKFAISVEETRYYLNGIYLHQNVDKNNLRAVATDGHRLAQVEISLPDGADGMSSIIIPRKTVGEVRKLIDDTEGDINITVSTNKIKFNINNCTLTSKLIDGSFPDYQRVIPKDNTNNMIVSTKEFKDAVDRVSTISIEKSRAVKLSLSKNNLILKVNSHDTGNASEELEVNFDGNPMEIGFNSKYLLDIALQIQGKEMQFSLSDSSSPALITDPEQEGIIFVLMPMRV